jgi:ribosome biogenesis SPOUT family RNA methylase Rps3
MRHPVPLSEIPYVDDPELRLDEHESTQMPFRYVKAPDGSPVMPKVSGATIQYIPMSASRADRSRGEVMVADSAV